MKKIKGFKDGIFFWNWDDQQYSTKLWVIICPKQIKDATAFMKNLTKESFEVSEGSMAMCNQRFDPKGRQNIFIVLRAGCAVGNIVHEVVHAKNFIFGYHGVHLDTDKDEHEAYYVDYLFRATEAVMQIYKDEVKKQKKKKKS